MTPERWTDLEPLLDQMLELDPAARSAFLDPPGSQSGALPDRAPAGQRRGVATPSEDLEEAMVR